MYAFFRLTTAFLLLTALAGCASVNSVSLTPIPSQRTKPVVASVSKNVFLAFSFDNDFIDPLVESLKTQCPNGVVSGILTKHEVINYVFVFTHRVTATGFCSAQTVAHAKSGRATGSDVTEGN